MKSSNRRSAAAVLATAAALSGVLTVGTTQTAQAATTQVYTLVSDSRLREVYLTSHPRARS